LDLVLSILTLMGRVFWETLTSPSFLLIYLLLFLITNWQYKRLEDMSASPRRYHPLHLRATLVSVLLGLLGGVMGSTILVLVGIDLSRVNILPLWITALLLMMISPRFLCFAYAGGILAIISLVTGYPQMDIPQLIALVAILHIVESLLIALNGHLTPVPVYLKRESQVVGGFNLQKFWPIPLLALASTGLMADPGALPPMPSWWPLLKTYSSAVPGQNYILLPVLAVLGYGEITTTAAPGQRVRKSSSYLLLYSLILLAISIGSSYRPSLVWLAALFAPLGHEMVIWLGRQQEKSQTALYVPAASGLLLLDVVPNSPAYKAGLRSGDLILKVNGQSIDHHHELLWLIQQYHNFHIEASRHGTVYQTNLKCPRSKDWGLTPVPEAGVTRYLALEEGTFFDLVRRLFRRFFA